MSEQFFRVVGSEVRRLCLSTRLVSLPACIPSLMTGPRGENGVLQVQNPLGFRTVVSISWARCRRSTRRRSISRRSGAVCAVLRVLGS